MRPRNFPERRNARRKRALVEIESRIAKWAKPRAAHDDLTKIAPIELLRTMAEGQRVRERIVESARDRRSKKIRVARRIA